MKTKQERGRTNGRGNGRKREYVGTGEAAKELGIDRSTLNRWIKEGRVKARRVGKQWRISRDDLAAMVEIHDTDSRPEPVEAGTAKRAEQIAAKALTIPGVTRAAIAAMEKDLEEHVLEQVDASDPDARKILSKIVLRGVLLQVLDIHFQPARDALRIRERIDGVLNESMRLPPELSGAIMDELLRWSYLNPAERRRPQDGRFVACLEGRTVCFRVSCLPSIRGMTAIVRILDPQAILLPLDELGFEPDQLETFRRAINRPAGLVVLTAPTGCGKTTTIYAALSELNDQSRKIMTVEDPVEYEIDGVVQTQMHAEVGLTFTSAARSVLRQAPDVLFIGEMRDGSVAELCVKAALTGHSVFTTCHTNDAVAGIGRLVDMGIEPKFVTDSGLTVVHQRLLRRICPKCRTTYRPKASELKALGVKSADRPAKFYHGKGCEHCGGRGYRGRVAVYELVQANHDMQKAIVAGDLKGLRARAKTAGWRPAREIAMLKVARGETTIEEVLRQVPEE